MKIAIMQPYFCPHIGYFQLVDAVDTFVFYDDVQYIKRGYINRNVLKNNVKFTVPVSNASTTKKIYEVNINWDNQFFSSFKKSLLNLYSKSLSYIEVMNIIDELFDSCPQTISELAIHSVKLFSRYLGIKTNFLKSSEIDYTKTNDRALNLINICKSQSCSHYINSIGGQKLYDKNFFSENGTNLNFIDSQSSLSIIDLCMNDSLPILQNKIKNYQLI